MNNLFLKNLLLNKTNNILNILKFYIMQLSSFIEKIDNNKIFLINTTN